MSTTTTASTSTGHVGTLTLDSPQYETFHSTRYGRARVIHAPTLVSFVPTAHIQTAVSITDERILIDTIYPPTSSRRGPTLDLQTHEEAIITALTQPKGDFRISTALNEETQKTLRELTVFPVPKSEVEGCPCVTCEMKLLDKLRKDKTPQQVAEKRRTKFTAPPPPPPRRSSKAPAKPQPQDTRRPSQDDVNMLDKVDEDTVLPSRRSSSLFLSTPPAYRT